MGHEERSDFFALEDFSDIVDIDTVSDDGLNACIAADFCGHDLGDHTAFCELRARALSETIDFRGYFMDTGNYNSIGVLFGVARVEPVNVGKQNEEFGSSQDSDVGGKPVVVTVADFIVADGIILINDGDHFGIEKRVNGVAGIEFSLFVKQSVLGDEELGNSKAML